jgi:TonB family protein
VKFDVDIDGTVGNITIERGVPGGHSLEQAVIDVCKQFPKFSPAMQNGKPIKSYFLLPINFKL